MTQQGAPETGWFDADKAHWLPQRVYYEDTDFSGVVYHAKYLHFLERGRTEALRCAGAGQRELLDLDQPLVFAVHRLSLTYRAPARMDDALMVRTCALSAKGARMIFNQEVRRADEMLVAAEVVVAAMSPQGRPMRIPAAVLEIMGRALAR